MARTTVIDYKTISSNLNMVIAEKGINKTELCKRLGISSSTTVAKRFNGYGWTLEEMVRCAAYMGKSVEDIFFSKLSTNANKNE